MTTRKRKRITLTTDEGGMLELSGGAWNPGSDVWLRIEWPEDYRGIDSVNFRGRRRAALHAFAKRIVRATAPRKLTRRTP